MSTPNHTPGPWGIERTSDTLWIGPLRADGKINELVTSVDVDPGYIEEALARNEANARLIAAAPDLLAACKAMMDAELCQPSSQVSKISQQVRAMLLAQEAITKAEGDKP